MKHRIKVMKTIGILAAMISMISSGCGANQILYSGKEKCDISVAENITITYEGNEYIVLEESIPANEIGAWVGYVNENISGAMFSTVYLDKTKEDMIHVAVDDCFYRAVKKENIVAEQIPMQIQDQEAFEEGKDVFPKDLEVNPDNATQLMGDGKMYQVTDETISMERLEGYRTCISEYVVFDADTKKVLSKEEYTKIDWDGTVSEGKNRTVWVYTDVYGIKDLDINSIGVKVNGVYYLATLVD